MNQPETTLEAQLRQRCQAAPISYRDFIEAALYTKDYGYYTQPAERVGRSPRHDFYTAESLGRVFAQLVTTAAEDLLPEGQAAESTFVEIAAEPGTSLLSHLESPPFAREQIIRQGEAIETEGPVVIFANEWLDALPFHRLIFRDGAWRERGVSLNAQGELAECLLDTLSPEVLAVAERLPAQIEDGYELDLPLAAERALAALLQQDWHGLILFFDYGRTWTSLLQDHPSGTARTYKQHAQSNDLLETPGARDITCDICWTPLMEQMERAALKSVTLESQEAFLVKRAQRALESIICNNAGNFSPERQTLMQLIHPANMGQRFQVLWGLRTKTSVT
jgi:SAM-dependent MidA family methyltransferase